MGEATLASRFQASAAATVDDLLRLQPEWATTLGDHRFDDSIEDLSAAGRADTAQLLRRRRCELDSLDPQRLDPEDRIDHRMLVGEIDRLLFEIDELGAASWDPLLYGVGEAFYPLLTRDVLPVPERLAAIAARLDRVPERLELARRQLEAPPRVHVETALSRHPGTVAMVGEEVDRLLAAEPKMAPVVQPAQRRALAALDSYATYLQELLDGPHRDPRIGPELFARRLQLRLHSPRSPEELLAQAERRMGEIDEELEEVARAYLGRDHGGGPATRTALDRVAADAPDDGTVVASTEAALRRCTETVRALGIVSIPDDPFRIETMPVFRRGIAVAYCDRAGPLEEGGESSFAIAPTPNDWNPEQKASFYREYNSAMLINLTVHEAMPGHMLQLAHARRFRGSTLVREVLWSGTFVEGWAVQAERIMAEAGLGGLPVRLQQLKMQLRMTINAILDVSVHAGELREEEALELMMTRGHQEESEARGKWRRACLTSAQLSTYFVGYSELAELFCELGGHPDYDEILAHGCPPPTLLAGLLAR
ncbi:MAG TPA: DUF885 domain-containing protein [Acidimicrobiales bacterium]|nr:DUF885 domain-containing protein [Acidimicrobiales bacterium]